MKFKNKVVIVTGGNHGFGRAICLALALDGARVAVAARSMDHIQRVVEEIGTDGGQALAVKLDVSDPSSVQSMVDRVRTTWGAVDMRVNNAGIQGKD